MSTPTDGRSIARGDVRNDVRTVAPLIEGANRTEHRTLGNANANRTRTEQAEQGGVIGMRIDLVRPSHAFIAARSAAQPEHAVAGCYTCAWSRTNGRRRRDQNEGRQSPMCFPTCCRSTIMRLISLGNACLRPMCANHRKGFSRALSHEPHKSWKQTRTREVATGETAEHAEWAGFSLEVRGVGWGVPQDGPTVRYIEVSPRFRGGPPQTLCCNSLQGAVACGP